MDWGFGGIRVVRFPGEQWGHHESSAGDRYSMAADVAEIAGATKITACTK
jgi:hypothetical protein